MSTLELRRFAIRSGERRALTTTEQNWLAALMIGIGSIFVFVLIGRIESGAGRAIVDGRLVHSAAEAAARYLGLGHFIVALAFTATSSRMKLAKHVAWFGWLLGLGTLLGLGYSWLRGVYPLLAYAFFAGYFLAHDFRDQLFFCRMNGDLGVRKDGRSPDADLLAVPILACAAVLSLLSVAAFVGLSGSDRYVAAVAHLPLAARWGLGIGPTLVVGPLLFCYWRHLNRRYTAGAGRFFMNQRPIVLIFSGSLLVLWLGLILRERFYPIVILHVTTWYVFTLFQFSRRSFSGPDARPLTWRWMRGTPAGFRFLHIGVVVLLVAGGLVWAYLFRNDPQVTALRVPLGPDVFPLWTIMHITVSFSRT